MLRQNGLMWLSVFPEFATAENLKFFKRWMILCGILHLVVAFFSSGFFHYDEHFQILEFLNYFQGKSPADALPWEFPAQIRSWTQPMIYFGISKVLLSVGISSPFTQATVFRVFSSFIGWLAICSLAMISRVWISDQKSYLWVIRGYALIWFFPFIHARTSGENLGSSLFWMGACLIAFSLEKAKRKPIELTQFPFWVSGILFGLAFLVRFQTILLCVGLGLWCIFLARLKIKYLIATLFGFLMAFGLGVVLDRLGYGTWTFTAWNYFNVNVIQDQMSQFSQRSAWFYVIRSIVTLPPLSSLLFFGAMVGCFKKRSHFLVWTIFPYCVFHSYISNRDLRFLFPILPIVPILVAFGCSHLSLNFKSKFWSRVIQFSICENLVALMLVSTISACSAISFYSYIYKNFPNGLNLYTLNGDPYEMVRLKLNYYKPAHYQYIWKSSIQEIQEAILSSTHPILFFDSDRTLLDHTPELKKVCRERFRIFPKWFDQLKWIKGWSGQGLWTLYECSQSHLKLNSEAQTHA